MNEMKKNNNFSIPELNFLYEMASLLMREDDFVEIDKKLEKLFCTKFGVSKVNIYLKEEQLILMKLFERFKSKDSIPSFKSLISKYNTVTSANVVFNDVVLDLEMAKNNFLEIYN